jgi:hypothetical protein
MRRPKKIIDPGDGRNFSEWNSGWRYGILWIAVVILLLVTAALVSAAVETIGAVADAF